MQELLNEEQQVEFIKHWWDRFGNLVLSILLGTILSLIVWQFWQKYENHQAEEASILYEALVSAIDKNELVVAMNQAEALTQHYKRSIYASYANLLLAKISIEKKEFDEAAAYFTWVRKNSRSLVLKELAEVRLAQLLIDQNKLEDALNLIDRTPVKVFLPLIEELRGDAELALGHTDNARAAYKNALDASTLARPVLKMKIARLVNLNTHHPRVAVS